MSALADRYLAFARETEAGSPSLRTWAEAVVADDALQAVIATLPEEKQQPNLVLGSARWHGAVAGDVGSLRDALTSRWDDVRGTVLARHTQTNEPARCAALLLGLQHVPGPVALLELGASAGLCLLPDRYSYATSDGQRLDPADGPSEAVIEVDLRGARLPDAMPRIAWRTGLERNPLDPADPDAAAWLTNLVWPEQTQRIARLEAALRVAAHERPTLYAGDIRSDLERIAALAPSDATLVVSHSATLAYLDAADRADVVARIRALGARRIGFEGRGGDPEAPSLDAPLSPDTQFVATLDGEPYAVADGHATTITGL